MSEEAGCAPPASPASPATPPHTDTVDASIAVSLHNVHQTGSSAPEAERKAEGGKWSCEVCTYENFPLSRKCTMCRSPRPTVSEDILRLQDGASALPPPPPSPPASTPTTPLAPHNTAVATATAGAESGGGVCVGTERPRPLRISSPQGASASAPLKWPCPTCTYENWPKSLKCAMCGTATPQPPQGTVERETGASAACVTVEKTGTCRRRAVTAHTPLPPPPDLLWLQACLGVVEGNPRAVDAYLSAGGDPARVLTSQEVALLNRASAFDAGHTLVHLAIRFQRQDILSKLLARISGGGPGLKRSPSYIAPDLAQAIRRHMAGCMRQKKGNFPAKYINEFCTFSLPAELEELPVPVQEQIFAELLDKEAQRTLEAEPPTINWALELTDPLGSKLYALWNRSAGDCLPDAVCQAMYGVFDRHNTLRHALADILSERGCARALYERWQAWERVEATALQYAVEEAALRAEWARLVAAAGTAGSPLTQLHVFALAHVVRRPIIVYGVNVVHSFRGEALGYARFQGIYLPLLWEPEPEFCSKSPLCVGYTRGHFSALVPEEPYHRHAYICREQAEEAEEVTFLPLTDSEGKLLPVHFLTCDEMGMAEALVRRWLAVCVTRGGLLCARQTLHARPLLVAQMLEEWLNHYRPLAQQTRGPFPPRLQPADLSSDPDTDDE